MKLSLYTNQIEYKDGVFLHNALYGSAIKVTSKECISEWKKLKASNAAKFDKNNTFHKALVDTKMLVNDEVDEPAIVNYKYYEGSKILQLILIVTRNCNFRCPYCFQDHIEKRMTWETYQCACQLLFTYLRAHKYDAVWINFFGGEPTLEIENIVNFMSLVKETAAIENLPNTMFHGHITSNAFLLNKTNFSRLLEAGVSRFQITIDGLEDTHNRTRVLANGVGTWQTIVKNLKNIKKVSGKFEIQLRTNYTKDILKDIDNYIDFYKETFSQDERFKLYFEAAKNYGTIDSPELLGIVKNEAITSVELLKIFETHGLQKMNFDNERNTHLFGISCYASNPSSFLIDYDGAIRKCSFDLDSRENLIGQITDGQVKISLDSLAKWCSYDVRDDCKKCSIYPVCYGRKCPSAYPRDLHLKEDTLRAHREYCNVIHTLYTNALKINYLFDT